MDISILTIATGKYIDFIPDLVKSSEEKFLKNHNKTYYIFTDSELDLKIKGVKKSMTRRKLIW